MFNFKFTRFGFILILFFSIILFAFCLSFFNNVLFNKNVAYGQSNEGFQIGRYQISTATAGKEGAGWFVITVIDTSTGKIWSRVISGYNTKQFAKVREGDNYYLWDISMDKK